uniref:Yellow-c2 n=1 Tax=Leptinotarsa decemlineata TaxID=7539 RepID=A0A290GB03_LEPDE|nr:yellow-c2 [Leptinotarsa decemlineata]
MLKLAIFTAFISVGESGRYGAGLPSDGFRRDNSGIKLQEVFAWSKIDYNWPNMEARDEAMRNGVYVAENNLPLGVAKWKNKLFVTVPRWRSGVPAALNYISLDTANATAPLNPYPDWKANALPREDETPTENHIVSPFRIKVDPCDRLWVMDTGLAGITDNHKRIFPSAVVIFDLKTDKLIRRYNLKRSDINGWSSLFSNIIVDVTKDTCDMAFAYIPDMQGYGLVVYSFADNNSWRVRHNYFNIDPLKGDLTIGGVSAQSPFGIISVALGPGKKNGKKLLAQLPIMISDKEMYFQRFRTAYFHSLASTSEFSVSTEVLRNQTLATDPRSYVLFKFEGNKGERAQSSASVFDEKRNVLFLGQIQEDLLACWNPSTKLTPQNVDVVAVDHEKLIFINDITIDDDQLWILSDRMPSFLYKLLNFNEVNYKIFKVSVEESIKGTRCAT